MNRLELEARMLDLSRMYESFFEARQAGTFNFAKFLALPSKDEYRDFSSWYWRRELAAACDLKGFWRRDVIQLGATIPANLLWLFSANYVMTYFNKFWWHMDCLFLKEYSHVLSDTARKHNLIIAGLKDAGTKYCVTERDFKHYEYGVSLRD